MTKNVLYREIIPFSMQKVDVYGIKVLYLSYTTPIIVICLV